MYTLFTLLPPYYNNKCLEFGDLELTYILNKTNFKDKFKSFINYYNKLVVIKNKKTFSILSELYDDNEIDKYFTLNLYTSNLEKNSKIIFKYEKNKNFITLYYDNDNILNKLFINNIKN